MFLNGFYIFSFQSVFISIQKVSQSLINSCDVEMYYLTPLTSFRMQNNVLIIDVSFVDFELNRSPVASWLHRYSDIPSDYVLPLAVIMLPEMPFVTIRF